MRLAVVMFHHAHCLHLEADGHSLGSLGEGIFLLKEGQQHGFFSGKAGIDICRAPAV